jgi:hypothetical protein
MHVDDKGDLILKREMRDHNRNTCHFAVNGLVTDHAYGKFDGSIALIVDPMQAGTPSGFGQADVWFHHDADQNLNVGRAVVVAPAGTFLPPGAAAIFYDPDEPDALQNAVNRHLVDVGIEPKNIGINGWIGDDIGEHDRWRVDMGSRLYGADAERIHLGQHDGSLDDEIDSAVNACQALYATAQSTYLHESDGGVQTKYTVHLSAKIDAARAAIESFGHTAPATVVEASAGYMRALEKKLDDLSEKNVVIEQKFSSPFFVTSIAGAPPLGPYNDHQVEQLIKNGHVARNAFIEDIRFGHGPELLTSMFADATWPALPVTIQVPGSGLPQSPPPLPGMGPPPLPGMTPPPLQPDGPPPLLPQTHDAKLARLISECSTNMLAAHSIDGLTAKDASEAVRVDLAALGAITDKEFHGVALAAIGASAIHQSAYMSELRDRDLDVSTMAVQGYASTLTKHRATAGTVIDGAYSGKVLHVAQGIVTQRIDRAGTIVQHNERILNGPVVAGQVIDIAYRDGAGRISSNEPTRDPQRGR